MTAAKVLLVDDYKDALDMWGVYLRSRGYEVVTAADGLTAMSIALDQIPDVIILDLDLPGITGYEAARRLRRGETTTHIPLIAATGFCMKKQLDEAHEAGFDSVMIKPCDPGALVDEIERVLNHPRGLPGTE